MIDCDKCREMISCLLDGELGEEEQALVRGHTASCPECRRVYEAFGAISGRLREPEPLPEGLHERIMSGITAKQKKRKTGIVWIKYLSAAACLALVIFAGAKSGVFSPGSDGVDVDCLQNAQAVTNGNEAEQSDGSSAEDGAQSVCPANGSVDEATAERLRSLLVPVQSAAGIGQDSRAALSDSEPDYGISLPGGGTLLIYFCGEEVYADFGDGAFLTSAGSDEIRALLE